MTEEPTVAQKMRGIPWRITANAANTIFVQFTFFGSVFILFLSDLGLSKTQIGFLLSLFPFFGLTALIVAPAVTRFGYKRTYLTFWGVRNIATAFLLLTPWIVLRFGSQMTLIFVTVIVATFALCRAVAETGWYPWAQEIIPDSIRGKFAAMNQIAITLVGLLAVTVAGYIIEQSSDLSGYMILIGVGVLCGLFSVWAYSFIPGGAPIRTAPSDQKQHRDLIDAIRDKGFQSYLAGLGLITLATVPIVSFLPLYMQEQVGLSQGQIVLLQNGTLLGGLLSSYLWGWAADRYGSKPVMMSGLFINIFLPLFWLLMPRQSGWSLATALGIAFLQGIGAIGWTFGSSRILYVSIVPTEKKSDYMALYYAYIGIVGGLSQLIGAWVLDLSHNLTGNLSFLTRDPYVPLFLLGLVLSLAGYAVFHRVKADHIVGVAEFAGIFLRGNPFQAMGSIIRYHYARDEQKTVMITERLSQSGSRLAVDELLEALIDPRFQVRFEAIISIAHMRPDSRLTEAVVKILTGNEIALSVIAAWALGRYGDKQALAPLRAALDSSYRSLQLHSIRALGTLNDTEMIPLFQQRLAQESDIGLQLAYAAALGHLRATDATTALLSMLEEIQNEGARLELALSLACIVGDEYTFMQLLRQSRNDVGTAVSLAISAVQKKQRKKLAKHLELTAVLNECSLRWGRGELDEGARLLSHAIDLFPEEMLLASDITILRACASQLAHQGAARLEYTLLIVHVLNHTLK